MTQVVYRGDLPIKVLGKLPHKGETAPDFSLTNKDLIDVSLADFAGKRKILNIFPSIDTSTCATSVRHFNQLANQLPDCVVLCISADLPFAQNRFCGAEGLENVITLSTFRSLRFMYEYGVEIGDTAMRGLAARAVIVLNQHNQVLHSELVHQIGHEPNYAAAIAVID